MSNRDAIYITVLALMTVLLSAYLGWAAGYSRGLKRGIEICHESREWVKE